MFLLPNPHCPIPTTTDEFKSRRTPIAAHYSRYVGFVYLRRDGELADVECVQVVVFGSQEEGGRECRRPGEGVTAHLFIF